MREHSETPYKWLREDHYHKTSQLFIVNDSHNVAQVYSEANAEFIVRACNSHKGLLEATKLLLAALHEGHADWVEKATSRGLAALAKAEGCV